MTIPNALSMTCNRCKVASTCTCNGSSPFVLPSKQQLLCRLIGGYGREPIDPSLLSEESKSMSECDGPCHPPPANGDTRSPLPRHRDEAAAPDALSAARAR